ncbi:hypothetical protein ACHWQZ_G014583 [Mnemiopsis leidyi]
MAYANPVLDVSDEALEEPPTDDNEQAQLEDIEIRSPSTLSPDPLPTSPESTESIQTYDLNNVLEAAGFGRYHIFFMIVLGMMSFADAAEIFMASVILKDMKCDFNLTPVQEAIIPAIVFFFYAIGSIVAGKLSDVYGRKKILLIGMIVLVISALLSAFVPSFWLFIACRGVTGFTIGANYGVSVVYFTEIVPVKHRSSAMLGMELFWTIGSVFECLVGMAVMMKYGWRAQVGITVVPCIFALVLLPFCDESARYYAISGQHDKALQVCTKICSRNRRKLPEGELKVSIEDRGSMSAVFSPEYLRHSIILILIFFINMYHVFAIVILLPDVLLNNYCSASSFLGKETNAKGCEILSKGDYEMLLVSALLSVPGFFLGTVVVEKLGRKKSFVFTALIQIICFCMALPCWGTWFLYLALAAMIISSTTFNQILWIYTPESYPTYIRNTAVGTLNALGKLGAASGTFIIETLDAKDIRGSLGTFIAFGFILVAATLLLKKETRNQALQDTREQQAGLTYATLQDSRI